MRVHFEANEVTEVDLQQFKGYERAALMMIMILVVHGELMDVIEMMLDRQADLVVHLEANEVTKEAEKVDWEKDEVIIETCDL